MGQVPNAAVKILVVGNGRLATALIATLREQARRPDAHPMAQWSRHGQNTSFSDTVRSFQPTHIWLAISDRAIEPFARENASDLKGRTLVHFAGSLASLDLDGVERVHSAHPLSTFAATGISPQEFEKIPFILDTGGPSLDDLLPGLKNATHRLAPRDRAYYHALCAIAGNFSVLLWETVSKRFENELHISGEALAAYRHQIFTNLMQAPDGQSVLTGPLARGDSKTIEAHHQALRAHDENSLLKIYDGFAELYLSESQKKRGLL